MLYIGYGPFPITVKTRIFPFLVGNPYKPLFATVAGKGPHPSYIQLYVDVDDTIPTAPVRSNLPNPRPGHGMSSLGT